YLIVYNKLFESQAEQLRAYRNSHDNFRSVKAEVEDIYDIFNYGIENPVAVRNFVKYAYTNWQSPGIKYICLFGRGSLDPKKNYGNSSIYYQNFVPVYGNPPSDGYFANMNFGTFVYYPQISVGRLPVYTTQEAQDIVNKIINYENNPLDVWIKKFNFITGGFSFSEQTQFINSSNNLINSYIASPPIVGSPVRIYRTDTSGQVSYNFEDSIKNVINRGNLIVEQKHRWF
ncbi:MAG: C25 family cysteine peptidase, partial [Ignavibacteriae bacterium]|nr:C25 family cysteine peptidase [Ignavibacteriota bacterium]